MRNKLFVAAASTRGSHFSLWRVHSQTQRAALAAKREELLSRGRPAASSVDVSALMRQHQDAIRSSGKTDDEDEDEDEDDSDEDDEEEYSSDSDAAAGGSDAHAVPPPTHVTGGAQIFVVQHDD